MSGGSGLSVDIHFAVFIFVLRSLLPHLLYSQNSSTTPMPITTTISDCTSSCYLLELKVHNSTLPFHTSSKYSTVGHFLYFPDAYVCTYVYMYVHMHNSRIHVRTYMYL